MENKIKSFCWWKHVPIKTHRTEQENFNFFCAFYRNEYEKDVLASEFVHHMYMSRNKKKGEKKWFLQLVRKINFNLFNCFCCNYIIQSLWAFSDLVFGAIDFVIKIFRSKFTWLFSCFFLQNMFSWIQFKSFSTCHSDSILPTPPLSLFFCLFFIPPLQWLLLFGSWTSNGKLQLTFLVWIFIEKKLLFSVMNYGSFLLRKHHFLLQVGCYQMRWERFSSFRLSLLASFPCELESFF